MATSLVIVERADVSMEIDVPIHPLDTQFSFQFIHLDLTSIGMVCASYEPLVKVFVDPVVEDSSLVLSIDRVHLFDLVFQTFIFYPPDR